MNDCIRMERLLEQCVADELTGDQERQLEQHTESCEDCASLLLLHRRLSQWEFDPDPATPEDLDSMRRAVMREVREQGSPQDTWRAAPRWRSSLRLGQLAAGFLLLFVGFFFGSMVTTDDDDSPRDNPLEVELQRLASTHRSLAETEKSPYAVSNLSMQEVDSQTVALSFDLATRLEVVRHPQDPLINELLAQSMLNPAPVGPRLETLSYAEGRLDPKVIEAMIEVVLNDPSLAVRLAALETIASYPSEANVEAALLQVLSDEDSTQMRLLAVDGLTRRKVEPRRLEEAIRGALPDVAAALKVRAGDYLQPM